MPATGVPVRIAAPADSGPAGQRRRQLARRRRRGTGSRGAGRAWPAASRTRRCTGASGGRVGVGGVAGQQQPGRLAAEQLLAHAGGGQQREPQQPQRLGGADAPQQLRRAADGRERGEERAQQRLLDASPLPAQAQPRLAVARVVGVEPRARCARRRGTGPRRRRRPGSAGGRARRARAPSAGRVLQVEGRAAPARPRRAGRTR